METYNENEEWWKSDKFKSYYVVWKLLFCCYYIILYFLFKSYYVVWKHIWIFCAFLAFSEFKSYYVVWKLVVYLNFSLKLPRLNRTM